MEFNGSAACHDRPYIRATDETQGRVIEVVAAEIVDHRAARAGSHKRIDIDIGVVEDCNAAHRLIGIVAPDNTLPCAGIVLLADARVEQ